jgi:hypothetical protein
MKDLSITREMIEAVVLAQLYREDPIERLIRITTKKYTSTELNKVYHNILSHPDFNKVKDEIIQMEKMTCVEDDNETVMLIYNKLLRDAQKEKKYEVAARILSEIRKLKAIDDAEQKFEIVITVKPPKVDSKPSKVVQSDSTAESETTVDPTSSE